ncbi:hypothetical protein PN466_24610 [Roseofilum reptotaenium CS-1145]|nr:hypothetical protein [Roseofilum reptotaenium]MDB9520132.1 hypothetical protein [Roseofilum reptotaenium CS-1145]
MTYSYTDSEYRYKFSQKSNPAIACPSPLNLLAVYNSDHIIIAHLHIET